MIYLYMQRFHLFLLVVTMTYSGRALATRAPCPEGSLHGTGRRGSTRICIDFPWGFHRQGYFFFFFFFSISEGRTRSHWEWNVWGITALYIGQSDFLNNCSTFFLPYYIVYHFNFLQVITWQISHAHKALVFFCTTAINKGLHAQQKKTKMEESKHIKQA